MFIWGNGTYQAQPGRPDPFGNFTPKRITYAVYRSAPGKVSSSFPIFRDVVMNKEFGFGLTSEGKVFAFENPPLPSAEPSDPEYFLEGPNGKVARHNVLMNLEDLKFAGSAAQVSLTREFLWVLDTKGDLHQLRLSRGDKPLGTWRKIPTVSGIKHLAAGEDHLLLLNKKDELLAMGDNTLGQCGLGSEERVPNPKKIPALEGRKVMRVWAGARHSFAETAEGDLLGWGSNSCLQLAHEAQFSTAVDPLTLISSPRTFRAYLEEADCDLQDVILGSDFSLFSCRAKSSGARQVFGTGSASRGQIPTGSPRHVLNFQKIEPLSDFTHARPGEREKDVEHRQISCGYDHCVSLTSLGVCLIWGDNEFGQLANKRRSFATSPLIISAFKEAEVQVIKATGNNCFAVVKEKKKEAQEKK